MSDDDDLADMAAFLDAPSSSSSSSSSSSAKQTTNLSIGQRVKISVNEDGVVVWYPATIVDYGDDNPFKVIYDGYSEVYEFSTSEDDYRVLHDDQPLANKIPSDVSKTQLQKRIWEILRILSITEGARMLSASDPMEEDTNEDDDNEEDVARLIRVGLADAKKGVRRLEDMLHGNSAAQPNAPGVKFFPNDKGGDRANGTQFSITYRLKAYMAPTKAWQYAADSLTLKEIPDDETELETLMGEIATMLSQLDADDASKYITTTSNSSKSSTTGTEIPALTNIFLIKPSDEALRDRLKTLQALQRWRACRGKQGKQVRVVSFRKIQTEHGKCTSNITGGCAELEALVQLYGKCIRWKTECSTSMPKTRSSRSSKKSRSQNKEENDDDDDDDDDDDNVSASKRLPKLLDLQRLASEAEEMSVQFEERKRLQEFIEIGVTYQEEAKEWIEKNEKECRNPKDAASLVTKYNNLGMEVEEGERLLRLGDYLRWAEEARLLLSKCDGTSSSTSSTSSNDERPSVESAYALVVRCEQELKKTEEGASEECDRLNALLTKAKEATEAVSEHLRLMNVDSNDARDEAEAMLVSLRAIPLRVEGAEEKTIRAIDMLSWYEKASAIVVESDANDANNANNANAANAAKDQESSKFSFVRESYNTMLERRIEQDNQNSWRLDRVSEIASKITDLHTKGETLFTAVENSINQSSSIEQMQNVLTSVEASPFSYERTKELSTKHTSGTTIQKEASTHLTTSNSVDMNVLESLLARAAALNITWEGMRHVEERALASRWIQDVTESVQNVPGMNASTLNGADAAVCKSLSRCERRHRKLAFVRKYHPQFVGDPTLQLLIKDTQRNLSAISWVERTRLALHQCEGGSGSNGNESKEGEAETDTETEKVTYEHLKSLMEECRHLTSTNVLPSNDKTEECPMRSHLTVTLQKVNEDQTRLSKALAERTDASSLEALHREISASSVRFTRLLHKVNNSMEIQRWILGAKIVLSGTRRTLGYLREQIATCPVDDEGADGNNTTDTTDTSNKDDNATHAFAVASLRKLKALKKEADTWSKRVFQIFATDEDGVSVLVEEPKPGVVSSDLGYYCCMDDESLYLVSKKLAVDMKEMLRINKRHISDLTSSARLMEGTCLDLPEGVRLPKEYEDARLRTAQSRKPLSSLKELKNLRKAPVLEKVRLESALLRLNQTIEAAETWSTRMNGDVLPRCVPNELVSASPEILNKLSNEVRKLVTDSYALPARLKLHSKLNRANALIQWFVRFSSLFQSVEIDPTTQKPIKPSMSDVLTLMDDAKKNKILAPLVDTTSSTPHPSFQQFCNISNSAIQWRHEARKGLAKKKDNDYLRDLIGRARSLRVIPEELSLLRLRMEHGDPPARGDDILDVLNKSETHLDPRRNSSQVRWIKYGSFPYWPGRLVPPWDEKSLPDFVRSVKHKSSRRAIYLFGLDMHAWIHPGINRIKRYQPSKDPNAYGVDGNGLFEQGKILARQFVTKENEDRRKMKETKEKNSRNNGHRQDDDGEFVLGGKQKRYQEAEDRAMEANMPNLGGDHKKRKSSSSSSSSSSNSNKTKRSRTSPDHYQQPILPRLSDQDVERQRKMVRSGLSYQMTTASKTIINQTKGRVFTKEVDNVCRDIEKELNKLYPVADRNPNYKVLYKSIWSNLKNVDNLQLVEKLLDGLLLPKDLVRMKPQDMASDELRRKRQAKVNQYLEENVVIKNRGSANDMIHEYSSNNVQLGGASAAPKFVADPRLQKEYKKNQKNGDNNNDDDEDDGDDTKKRKRKRDNENGNGGDEEDGSELPPRKKQPSINLPKLKKMASNIKQEPKQTEKEAAAALAEEEMVASPISIPPSPEEPSVPTSVWSGIITTDKQKRDKNTFSATMIDQSPSKAHPPPALLSTMTALHIIGRSQLAKVDSYTSKPGSRSVYVYGLEVQHDHPAYVRLMSEYETDRRVAVVTLPTGSAYVVPASLRNDIEVVRNKINIPKGCPVCILVVKSTANGSDRNARSASTGRGRKRSPSPPANQRRAPPKRGGGVRTSTTGSVNDLFNSLTSFQGAGVAATAAAPVYGGGQYAYAQPQMGQQMGQQRGQQRGQPMGQPMGQQMYRPPPPPPQQQQQQAWRHPGYQQPPQQQQQQQLQYGPPGTYGRAPTYGGQQPPPQYGARGIQQQQQVPPRAALPAGGRGRGRAAVLPAWMQSGR